MFQSPFGILPTLTIILMSDGTKQSEFQSPFGILPTLTISGAKTTAGVGPVSIPIRDSPYFDLVSRHPAAIQFLRFNPHSGFSLL